MPTARNLGVIIDEGLSLKPHIASLVKSCRFYIHELWKIRKYLTAETTKTIVHATIISRIDYCNSLYINLPDSYIDPLEKVLREAARLVTLTARRSSITSVMCSLHWLPVKFRIKCKVLLLVFKALHGLAPPYIREMITPYTPSRRLRSTEKGLLVEPRFRLTTVGLRSFQVAAPREWNTLPFSLRNATSVTTFKKDLKTHLFKLAYDGILDN